MRIFIEGEYYNSSLLQSLFGDKFYTRKNNSLGKIEQVGFFHSKNNELIYLLPKVFINKTGDVSLIKNYCPQDLASKPISETITDLLELNWVRRFLIIFYKGLIEYKNRYNDTILSKDDILQLNTTLGKSEFSYLDIVLSIINFHKKNKNTILFRYKENESLKHKSVKWNQTVKKTTPFFTKKNEPVYFKTRIKKKEINNEEELLTLFYSVLYHLKKEYQLKITFNNIYALYKGAAFDKIAKRAPRILKKIRYKYFSDTLLKIYNLLQIYFAKHNLASVRKKKEDYIMVKDYHLVFEDMIDKLFSDNLQKQQTSKGVSLNKLKTHKDGKELDHIFEHEALIDRDESIYYIGDSKYYKTQNKISGNSIYKQFTYAKNVIQFNIDLLNENKQLNDSLKYRDDITEGYNITPNFFIQGVINDINDFESHHLKQDSTKKIEHSYHYRDRLFDRDSLFVYYYNINFLFVLNAYPKKDLSILQSFKDSIKLDFRKNFITYFKKQQKFQFYTIDFNNLDELTNFITKEFRLLNGKIYRSKLLPLQVIIAKHRQDQALSSRLIITNTPINGRSIKYYCLDGSVQQVKDFLFT